MTMPTTIGKQAPALHEDQFVADVLVGLQADQQHEQAEGDERRRRALRASRAGDDVVRGLRLRLQWLRPWAQTFSTSGRPSMPDGRKISTIARIEKAATSL